MGFISLIYLFIYFIYSENSSKIFQSSMTIFKECVREIYKVLLTNFEQRDFSLGRLFYVHFSTAKYQLLCKIRVCLKYITAERKPTVYNGFRREKRKKTRLILRYGSEHCCDSRLQQYNCHDRWYLH
jgi:hypothetical protein